MADSEEKVFETVGDAIDASAADTEDLLGLTIDEARERAVLFAFDEAKTILEQGGQLVPFSVMVVGEDLYVENHPGEDVAECFSSAQKKIFSMQLKIDSYVFCYDGYVELDDETKDAIIAESALSGEESARAYALLYEEKGDTLVFEDALADLGEAPVLFLDGPFSLEELGDEGSDD